MASRYPAFDVTQHASAWDDHTRSIVLGRLEPASAPSHLTGDEAETLKRALRLLLDEDREELLSFVIAHFDEKLGAKAGESQRKAGLPPFPQLLRQGLAVLDALGEARWGKRFAVCAPEQQRAILAGLQLGSAGEIPSGAGARQPQGGSLQLAFPQKDFFQQLLSTAVEAYASHPVIWSEIGYAGPAYPRGYYRIERGLTDPWEPRAERKGALDGRNGTPQ